MFVCAENGVAILLGGTATLGCLPPPTPLTQKGPLPRRQQIPP